MFLKQLHALLAVVSIAGFLLRGYWMMSGSALLGHRLVKILPHVVDTLFLSAGIGLLFLLSGNVLGQAWMLVKIAGLVAYIVLGTMALKRGRTMQARLVAFVAAVAVYAYVYGVALSKSPASWIAWLAR